MKTIFEKSTRDKLIGRINTLNENDMALWGKMDVCQMLNHCIKYENMMQSKVKYKRLFIGYLFGQSALKKDFLKDSGPIKKNTPTLKQLKATPNSDSFVYNKLQWRKLIDDYADYQAKEIIHPFFGKLSPKQVGHLVYKHTDHHLRQFGV